MRTPAGGDLLRMGKRDLLALSDLTSAEVRGLLRRAAVLKKRPAGSGARMPLRGRTLGLLFEKASTRTRLSFEAAMVQMGGQAIFLAGDALQLQRGESIEDTARVISRYLDGLVVRTFGQETLVKWARFARVPVINGLTDSHHPCQALGDLLTIRERFGRLKGLKLAYVGDGHNNVAHSLLEGTARVGMHMRIASPEGYGPDAGILRAARQAGRRTGARLELVRDPTRAVAEADVIYTDVWVSMGKEGEARRRMRALKPYQVNDRLLDAAGQQAVVMHCLPAYRDREISAAVLDGPRSIVWDQAENRLHIQKAILELLL